MLEKLGYRSPSPLTTLAELESKIWEVNQMQTRAKIVSYNLKMTAPTKHAQLVSTIFDDEKNNMCLTEGNLLIQAQVHTMQIIVNAENIINY